MLRDVLPEVAFVFISITHIYSYMRYDIQYIFQISSCIGSADCDFSGEGPNKRAGIDVLVHFAVCDYTRFSTRTGFHDPYFHITAIYLPQLALFSSLTD